MLIYSSTITPRLKYITDFSGKEVIGKSFDVTTDLNYFQQYNEAKINYSPGRITTDEFWVMPHSLLFENNIIEQPIQCFDANGRKAFFRSDGDFPFDIFAACFYLLSRYEEYLPHKKDIYGRYAHENSLAFREGFLDQPLINLWLKDFKDALKTTFPNLTSESSGHHSLFTLLPTYDIDIAWSYQHKGWWRSVGGSIQSLVQGNWKQFRERLNVLNRKQKDPFDSYGWLNQLHQQHNLKPYYFFLMAEKTSRYDKNISPRQKALKDLISDHLIRYPVGIHPSWRSGDEPSSLKKEIAQLQKVTGNKVLSSRQHYIRFTLPETFRRLIDEGIQFDFSMGYGSINGFRASVTSPFYWYDLERERQTELILFPFCFMDANSFYEQKYTPQLALEEMRHFYQSVRSVEGTFIMIWHNNFFGTDNLYNGWKQIYEQFIKEVAK